MREKREDGWMSVLSDQHVDNPQVILAVMTRRTGFKSEEEDEEQTRDTWSNLTTDLKTSASTWHCAICCSQVLARRGLERKAGGTD